MSSERVKLFFGGIYYFRGSQYKREGDAPVCWAKPPQFYRLIGEATHITTGAYLLILGPDPDPGDSTGLLAVTLAYLRDNFDEPRLTITPADASAPALAVTMPLRVAGATTPGILHPVDVELQRLIHNEL